MTLYSKYTKALTFENLVQQLHSATLRARAPVGGVEGSQSGEVIEEIEVAGGDLGLIECLCGVFPRPHRLRHILDRVPGVVFRITNPRICRR